jgi:glucose/arabinose dehydrogenase
LILQAEALDPKHGSAEIRRFALNNIPSGGYNWTNGELVAWGMRNAVGIAVTINGTTLWTVENSADDISYQGIDVHTVSIYLLGNWFQLIITRIIPPKN